jgi:glucose-6-phosphate 1-dehydrogenase
MKLRLPAYEGELIKPIILPDRRNKFDRLSMSAMIVSREDIADEQTLINSEQAKKFPLLFNYFCIDASSPTAWEQLAKLLAEKHVAGFRYICAQGAPAKIDFAIIYEERSQSVPLNRLFARR